MKDWFERDARTIAGTYGRFPLMLVSGQGSEVYDRDGKTYIDMTSGIGVSALGVADPLWAEAVSAQAHMLTHMSNLYYTEPCIRLAEELCRRTGMRKVFFANSGAEANECAIKTARKYAQDKKGKEYDKIITLCGSFHGRTVTTLAATGQEVFHTKFFPLTEGFLYAAPGDLETVKMYIETEHVCAVMFECVQGEGGVLPLDPVFVSDLAALCAANDVLLVVDEVQTGNGRCGTLYCYEQYGIAPDIVTTAKGLGGGLPIGACLFGDKTEATLGRGDHGSTFGGNPIACAGALSVLERLDEAFLETVRQKSAYVFDRLCGAPGIRSVSGKGLMIGIETDKPASEVLRLCMEQGVLCLTAKTKVRLLPALNIPLDLLDRALTVLLAACAPDKECVI